MEGCGAETHPRFQRDGHRRVDPGQLLDRDAVGDVIGSATAVLGWERQPEESELAHGEHRVDRERVIAVPRFGVRGDLRLSELTHDAAELNLFGRQVELHERHGTAAVASCSMAALTVPAVLAHLPFGGGGAVVRDGDATIVAVDPVEVRGRVG